MAICEKIASSAGWLDNIGDMRKYRKKKTPLNFLWSVKNH